MTKLKSITTVGPETEARLRSAGISTPSALALADTERLANRIDMPVERVEDIQRRAEDAAEETTDLGAFATHDDPLVRVFEALDRYVDEGKSVLSASEFLDMYAVEYADMRPSEFAELRGVGAEAVRKNRRQAAAVLSESGLTTEEVVELLDR
jgi:hypothetical protein